MVLCSAGLSDRFRSHRAILTIGGQSGSLTDAVTTDLASVAALARDQRSLNNASRPLGNSPTTGAVSMTVRGVNFGVIEYSNSMRMGPTACEASGWISDSSLQCNAMASSTFLADVTLTMASFRSTATNLFTADLAALSGMRRYNAPGTGSASVTVHGSGLGLVAFTALGRVGQTGCEGTEWESETSVRCLVGHGAPGTRRVVMTAGERGSGSASVLG